jgi:hypothetical protein
MRRQRHVYKGKAIDQRDIKIGKLVLQDILSYGQEDLIHPSKSFFRETLEKGYLRRIDKYLDELGVDEYGTPLHLLEIPQPIEEQVPVNLNIELEADRRLYRNEYEFDSESYSPSDGELLHQRGIHITSDPGFAYSS